MKFVKKNKKFIAILAVTLFTALAVATLFFKGAKFTDDGDGIKLYKIIFGVKKSEIGGLVGATGGLSYFGLLSIITLGIGFLGSILTFVLHDDKFAKIGCICLLLSLIFAFLIFVAGTDLNYNLTIINTTQKFSDFYENTKVAYGYVLYIIFIALTLASSLALIIVKDDKKSKKRK